MCAEVSMAFIDKTGYFLNVSLPSEKGASLYLEIPFSIQPSNKEEIGNNNASIFCIICLPLSPHITKQH